MKYRYKFIQESVIELKLLINHPMSDLPDGSRQVIEELNITKNGALIFRAHPSEAVSKNPFFRLALHHVAVQDTVEINWLDNMGNYEYVSFVLEEV